MGDGSTGLDRDDGTVGALEATFEHLLRDTLRRGAGSRLAGESRASAVAVRWTPTGASAVLLLLVLEREHEQSPGASSYPDRRGVAVLGIADEGAFPCDRALQALAPRTIAV